MFLETCKSGMVFIAFGTVRTMFTWIWLIDRGRSKRWKGAHNGDQISGTLQTNTLTQADRQKNCRYQYKRHTMALSHLQVLYAFFLHYWDFHKQPTLRLARFKAQLEGRKYRERERMCLNCSLLLTGKLEVPSQITRAVSKC